MTNVRFLSCLAASLLGAAVTLAQPPAASAEGDQNWPTTTAAMPTATEQLERAAADYGEATRIAPTDARKLGAAQ
jgi:hypothetical protein